MSSKDVFSLEPILGRITQESVTFICSVDELKYKVFIVFYAGGDLVESLTTEVMLCKGVNNIIINNLESDMLYRCEWRADTHITSREAGEYTDPLEIGGDLLFEFTVSTKNTGMICALSCDNPDLDIGNSLWNKLAYIKPDMCIHLGDNIYGDRVFTRCEKNKIHIMDCMNQYRRCYNKTWNRWGRLLRDTWHVAIPDDHEVCDGYTRAPMSTTRRRSIAIRGESVCKEYQLGMSRETESDYIYMIPIDVDAVAIVISRIATDNKTVGEHVIKKIEELIAPYGDQIQRLMLFFSFPPLPVVTSWLHSKVFGKWPSKKEDVLMFYNWCFSWMRSSMNRNILVVGGDIHMGVDCKISHPSQDLHFHVYAAGPISNQPTPAEYTQAKALMAMKTFGDYKISSQAKCKRNFLLINPNTMKGHHVYAKDNVCSPFDLIKGSAKLLGAI